MIRSFRLISIVTILRQSMIVCSLKWQIEIHSSRKRRYQSRTNINILTWMSRFVFLLENFYEHDEIYYWSREKEEEKKMSWYKAKECVERKGHAVCMLEEEKRRQICFLVSLFFLRSIVLFSNGQQTAEKDKEIDWTRRTIGQKRREEEKKTREDRGQHLRAGSKDRTTVYDRVNTTEQENGWIWLTICDKTEILST